MTKKSGKINLEDETVLYSLDSRMSRPLRSEMRSRVRKHKVVTIEEQAEKQTEALNKILGDISRKEKDKEKKTKENKQTKKEQEEKENKLKRNRKRKML